MHVREQKSQRQINATGCIAHDGHNCIQDNSRITETEEFSIG